MTNETARTFGFTLLELGDHELAEFLREQGAADSHTRTGSSNTWWGPDGRAVAAVYYHGDGGMETKRYVRDDLAARARAICAAHRRRKK